ncbi:MAG: tetratricopeptide repeat protein [Phycisphaerae bacterium]|nr:tetratricopeptide repeat protein [Phycisphaerae bacterium]
MKTLPRFAWSVALIVVSLVCGRTLLARQGGTERPAPPAERSGGDARLRAGLGLLRQGVPDLAAVELRAYLETNPDQAGADQARYALGVCLFRLRQFEAAEAELAAVSERAGFEFGADALLLRARGAFEQGRFGEAADRLGVIQKKHPEFAQLARVMALRVEALHRAGSFSDAAAAAEAFLRERASDEARARVALFGALAFAARGDHESAARLAADARDPAGPLNERAALVEAQARHALGQSAAAGIYRSLERVGDASIRHAAMLGLLQLERAGGEASGAVARADELLAQHPSASLAARARLEKGRALLDCGRAREALASIDTIGRDADAALFDEATYWSSRCLMELDRIDDAIRKLAGRLDQGWNGELAVEMGLELAAALDRAGRREEARSVWSRVAKDYPDHALSGEAALARAASLHADHRFDESLDACRGLADRLSDSARADEARVLVADNLYFLERYAESEEACRGVRGPGAASWRARFRKGMCLIRLNRGAEGAAELETILTGEGGDAAATRAGWAAIGAVAFDACDWARAARAYERAVASEPDRELQADLALRAGLALVRGGEAEASLPWFERVSEMGSGARQESVIRARFELGRARLAMGLSDKARADFEAVVGAEQAAGAAGLLSHALRQLAGIASASGDANQAAALLTRAHAIDPDPTSKGESALALATVLLASGREAEAEATLRGFVDSNPGDSRLPEARARLAVALARQRPDTAALAALEAAERADLDPTLRASLVSERAFVLNELGRLDEAFRVYEELVGLHAGEGITAHAMLELARIDLDRERYDRVIERLGGVDVDAPGGSAESVRRVLYMRAVAEARSAKRSAVDSLGAFLRRFPDDPAAPGVRMLRAEALLGAERVGEAVEELRALARGGSDELRGRALLRLGDAHARLQQWAASDEAFTKYIDAYADAEQWFRARFGQGWARENQSRHDAAIEAYREVAARHTGPTGARAQFQIGECLFALGRHEDAARELLKVEVLFAVPEWSAAAAYEAGRCFAALQRREDAARQFQRVIDQFPESEWAGQARAALERGRPEPLPGARERAKGASGAAAKK